MNAAAHRVLPHDLDCEASILGGVILRNEVLAQLPALEIHDFYHHHHKVVFEAIRNLEAQDRPIDVVMIGHEIEKRGKLEAIGGIAFLGELALHIPTVDNVLEYAAIVQRLSRNRRAILELSSAAERAYNWQHDPAELISETIGQLQRLDDLAQSPQKRLKLMTIDDALDDLVGISNATVFSTPFETLNHAMGFGGILGTQVYTVAAGTGRGKTTWVGALAAHVAESGPPVLVSVHELGPGYFVARKAAGLLGRHSNDILRGEVDRDLIRRAMPYPNMFFLKRPSLEELREATDFIAQKFGRPPLLIVDYLQKLADELAAKMQRPDLRLATSAASTALLEIGERTGAGIVAVSSIGRGKNALKSPRKSHPYDLVEVAKESGAVEYDGAGMIVLTLSDEFEGDERIGTITLAKARFGTEMHIDARYQGARGMWRDCGEVEREEPEQKTARTGAKPGPKANVREEQEDVVRTRIVTELNKQPARNKTSLKDRVTGCRRETVGQLINRMIDEGVIVEMDLGLTLSPTGRQLVIEVAK